MYVYILSFLFVVPLTFCRDVGKKHNEMHTFVECDDGKFGIDIDLHGDSDWKCYEDSKWPESTKYESNKTCYKHERAYHICIDRPIENMYKSDIPHSGPHREVWAQFGEYKYLPAGRYVHNLEHGAVVFMYHPCAPTEMVNKLRRVATSCLYKYILTAFPKLTKEYPFAVITYGCIFRMSTVEPDQIKEWVRDQFGESPESDEYENGNYTYGLLTPSIEPEDIQDEIDNFCPDTNEDYNTLSDNSEIIEESPSDLNKMQDVNKDKKMPEENNFDHFQGDLNGKEVEINEVEQKETQAYLEESEYPTEISQETQKEMHEFEIPTKTDESRMDSKEENQDRVEVEEYDAASYEETVPVATNTMQEYEEKSNIPTEISQETQKEMHEFEIPTKTTESRMDSKEENQDRVEVEEYDVASYEETVPVATNTMQEYEEKSNIPTDIYGSQPDSNEENRYPVEKEENGDVASYEESVPVATPTVITKSEKVTTTPSKRIDPKSQSAIINEIEVKDNNIKEVSINKSEDSGFFWVIISIVCFLFGLVLGLCVTKCGHRNDGNNVKKLRVWNDRNSADSFSIAAVVRKIPETFNKSRGQNENYHRLETNMNSSDEENIV